jgi:SAM-dependent methyltransferase
MSNEYKNFWEATSLEDAWQKIILSPKDPGTSPAEMESSVALLLNGIPDGGEALEIGAGVGRLMRAMVPHFNHVCGVDMSESMVTLSKDVLKDYPTCEVKLGDGYKLPFSDEMFDFVYSYITFQHMPDLACIRSNIAEVHRALKSGGLCRIQTLKATPPKSEGYHAHFPFEREEEFREEFLRCGFEAEVHTTDLIGCPPDPEVSVIWVTGRKK